MKGIAITKHFRTPVVSVVAVFAACLVVLLLGVRVTDAQTSSPAYTVTDLGTLGGNYSLAYDINNNGEIVGSSGTAGSNNYDRAFYWVGGQMRDIGQLADAKIGENGNSKAVGINDLGHVALEWSPSQGTTARHNFIYDRHDPTELSENIGGARLNAISEEDQLAGTTCYSNIHACLYQNGFWYDLGTLGGSQSVAFDINDSGLVVGSSGTWSTRFGREVVHAFAYQNGQMQDIDDFQSFRSEALGINDNGDVVGYYFDDSGYYHAFLWSSNGGTQDLGVPDSGYPNSFAYDINNNGEIVGTSGTTENAVRYKNGQWQYLNNLIPADSGWNLQRAEAINDEGQIVGWGSMNGETHAFLLTPGSSTPSDTTKPTITVNSPIEGATYKLGESVAADYSCSDDTSSGSDLSCTGSVPNGSALDTSSVGPKTFTVTSTDKAGNTETKTVNYSVIYNLSGFFQPVDNLSTFNKTKAGKTIPVRFSLGGNQGTDIFADGYPKSAPVACNSTAPVDGI